jgi:hypothetical protein
MTAEIRVNQVSPYQDGIPCTLFENINIPASSEKKAIVVATLCTIPSAFIGMPGTPGLSRNTPENINPIPYRVNVIPIIADLIL